MRIAAILALAFACAQDAEKVGKPPEELKLPAFYAKHLDSGGLPILGSEKVPDAALVEARTIILRMTSKRPDVLKAMIERKTRIAIMAKTEVTTDIPEHRDLPSAFPGTDWNRRCRGVGATRARPVCSGAEENVLQYENDRYRGESILIHEFGHTMYAMGIAPIDADFKTQLQAAYQGAMEKGLFKNTYAATNIDEYWAEGVQDWFDANLKSVPPNGIHNEICTRSQLKEYDVALAALLERVFGDGDWRWTPKPPRK